MTSFPSFVLYVDPFCLGSPLLSSFGRLPQLLAFSGGSRLSVRCADGASMTATVAPFAAQLHQYCQHAQFGKAIRLCRLVKA
jgi:hypothetical protein